jgi:hypothetical protein
MVTSQGVYNHIQTQLGPFKGKTVTTESVGIAATDNDTSVPTCAAVNDAITHKIAIYEKASGTASPNAALPITETSDPDNIGSVNSGTVTLSAGTYLVSYFGQYKENNDSSSSYWNVQLRHNGSAKLTAQVNETDQGDDPTYVTVSGTTAVSSNSSQTVDIYFTKSSHFTTLIYLNVNLTIVKLA